MERWENKVAIITGASSGIGAAVSKVLVKKGLLVVGLARRLEMLEDINKELLDERGRFYAVKCDITKEDDILNIFKWVTEDIGPVHILINNAGLTRPTNLTDGSTEEWRRIFDVNVLGLCICTREAYKVMTEHKIDGHIIHINSIVGHIVINLPIPNFNVYPASKHAVTALTESLRQEMRYLQSKIKVTSISPGYVQTEFAEGFPEDGTKEALDSGVYLQADDITEAILFTLSRPPHVQVHELTIKPVGELF